MELEPNLISFMLTLIMGYLVGSIPSGLIITKISGLKDLRKLGSGNIGATNVLRSSGPFLAGLTLFFDGGKGIIAVLIGTYTFVPEASEIIGLVSGAGAVLGHNFPIWLKLKGGKGVATTLGVMLGSVPIIGAMACIIWVSMAIIFRYSSVAALIALAVAPIFALLLGMNTSALMFAALGILGWVRHWPNISRLIKGDEPYIGK